MARRAHNVYRITADTNHTGKYEVRLEVRYAANGWALRVYFLAGTPDRAVNRAQAVLRYLQKNEEELWLWGSNPSDRGLLFEELLDRVGVTLDRRRESPRAAVLLTASPGEPLRPLQLGELKRKLLRRLQPPARVTRRPAPALRSA